MTKLVRTDSENPDFVFLVGHLDKELAVRDGDEHDFYHQYNHIDAIRYVVLAYENDVAMACGAVKEYDEDTMEVKRMYTLPEHRGKGLASMVLSELERWTGELSFGRCLLETGINQPEAIALYLKSGYIQVPNYGQYQNAPNSRCFEKRL